jgi:SAM-dependent methyltransferase
MSKFVLPCPALCSDLFVPRDRQREAFRDQKLTMKMPGDGSTMTLPPPSFVALALDRLGLAGGAANAGRTTPVTAFLDAGCGSGYVTALAACLLGERAAEAAVAVAEGSGGTSATATAMLRSTVVVHGVECAAARLEAASANLRALRERLSATASSATASVGGGAHAAGPLCATSAQASRTDQ